MIIICFVKPNSDYCTDAEDILNEKNTISHSTTLESVETLLDYMDKEDLITMSLLCFKVRK